MKPTGPLSSSKLETQSSEKRFGFFFAFVFLAIGIYEVFWAGSGNFAYGWFVLSIAFSCLAVFLPSYLKILNTTWMFLGDLLGSIVSPIVLGIIFFGLITPIALATRLFGRDELRLRRYSENSYWIERDLSEQIPSSFLNQF